MLTHEMWFLSPNMPFLHPFNSLRFTFFSETLKTWRSLIRIDFYPRIRRSDVPFAAGPYNCIGRGFIEALPLRRKIFHFINCQNKISVETWRHDDASRGRFSTSERYSFAILRGDNDAGDSIWRIFIWNYVHRREQDSGNASNSRVIA